MLLSCCLDMGGAISDERSYLADTSAELHVDTSYHDDSNVALTPGTPQLRDALKRVVAPHRHGKLALDAKKAVEEVKNVQSLETITITPEDFPRILSMLGVKIDSAELEDLYKEVDTDASGDLSLEEFLVWVTDMANKEVKTITACNQTLKAQLRAALKELKLLHKANGESHFRIFRSPELESIEQDPTIGFFYDSVDEDTHVSEHNRRASIERYAGRMGRVHAVHENRTSYWWNNRYQAALMAVYSAQTTQESEIRMQRLLEIVHDFTQLVDLYSKVIISEMFLPQSHRTCRPIKDAVFAGFAGDTFLIQGIKFRIVNDTYNLYGGNVGAMKAAGHHIRSHSFLQNRVVHMKKEMSLRQPLTAVVDYRGSRVIAIAHHPQQHLVYGCNTAMAPRKLLASMKPLVVADECVSTTMSKIGVALRCSSHQVGANSTTVSMAADVCVFRVIDSGDVSQDEEEDSDPVYYVTRVGRMVPPQTPMAGTRGSHIIHRFRPEYMLRYGKTLNPDAYSNFTKFDPQAREYDEEVDAATHRLVADVIPEFCRVLEGVTYDIDLAVFMHRWGINLRYLGVVLVRVQSVMWRQRAMQEILARAIKTIIRSGMRRANREKGTIALGVFNSILENTVFNMLNSDDFWNSTVRAECDKKFIGFRLPNTDDMASVSKVSDSVGGIEAVIERLNAIAEFRIDPEKCQFGGRLWDCPGVEVGAKLKRLSFLDRMEGELYGIKVLNEDNQARAESLLDMALKSYHKALRHSPVASATLHDMAVLMGKHIMRYPDVFPDRFREVLVLIAQVLLPTDGEKANESRVRVPDSIKQVMHGMFHLSKKVLNAALAQDIAEHFSLLPPYLVGQELGSSVVGSRYKNIQGIVG